MLVDILALIDELAAPSTSATDKKDALAEIIDEIERQLQDDLDGNGTIGAKPTPAGTKLFRYSIPGFTVSFTGPRANQSPAVVDRADPGSGCGDPAKSRWTIPIAISGFGAPFSATRAVTFATQNPLVLMGNNFTSDTGGPSTASVRVNLRYVGGNTPTVKVETAATGDITGLRPRPTRCA